MAAQILEDHLNASSWIDGLVSGSLLDFDQWLTFYGAGKSRMTHNFYTTVFQPGGPETARISLIPWDFDRCWGICNTKTCSGGGSLGNLMQTGAMPVPKGWDMYHVPWTNCLSPPWWVDTMRQPSFYKKYCVDGVRTHLHHASHPACDPVVNLMGRAWKKKYAERMTDFLRAAEEWGNDQLTAYILQIQDVVAEDATQGGYPKMTNWQKAIEGTKERFAEVVEFGRKLASAALDAHNEECSAPTCDALRCFGSSSKSCDAGVAGGGSDVCPSGSVEDTCCSESSSTQSQDKASKEVANNAMPHRFSFSTMLASCLFLSLRH
eukprot:gnl/TRDRNA2_/TRDRNA2_173161_c1_seq9.p1 gnl/TRDRNA2_/TRDRNA2_173161_c1~~gnl/TRDRNA2_/TRDRNA2_173161_c1_seq9.p1  ORF type:complete len:350 (+),score=54.38 gnl/TRDRNA2_/TRDRNA2_173161_c1_seq9:89-1051(+)